MTHPEQALHRKAHTKTLSAQPERMVAALCPGYPGELFLNALQELVLPLIALALLNGVLSLRHSTAGCAPRPEKEAGSVL